MAETYSVEDFSAASVKVLVNGEYHDEYAADEQTAGEMISSVASDAGFKRFTVLLNGEPFSSSRKAEKLAAGSVLDIVAKDDRA